MASANATGVSWTRAVTSPTASVRNASGCKPEPVDVGHPAGCVQDGVGVQHFTVGECDLESRACPSHGGDLRVQAQVDTAFAHFLRQEMADFQIEAAQDLLSAV